MDASQAIADNNPTETKNIEAFIARWADAGGSERANYQLFLTELCTVLVLN